MYYHGLKGDNKADYYPVDMNPDRYKRCPLRDIVDIQKLPYGERMFDAIVCVGVLEHIPDDQAALKELHRVLNQDGALYIHVPLNEKLSETLDNPEYNTPELRTKYYGQSDHLRLYGNNFAKFLESIGFVVEQIATNEEFSNSELSCYGLTKSKKIFKCTLREYWRNCI